MARLLLLVTVICLLVNICKVSASVQTVSAGGIPWRTLMQNALQSHSKHSMTSETVKCSTDAYPPDPSTSITKKYIINLDLPPEQRWIPLMKDKSTEMRNLVYVLTNYTDKFFHGRLRHFIDSQLPALAKTLPTPFYQEVNSISEVTGVSLGEVTLYNIFYEVFSVCTSIVTKARGHKLYHVRNMDFGLFMGWDSRNHTWAITEALHPLVVDLDFQRSGKTVFKSVGFAGYVGVLTAMKPGLFSLTVNERFTLEGGFVGIYRWLAGDRTEQWVGFLTRRVMETADSYHHAMKRLSETKILAPAYFIVGGNKSNQACVITRDLDKFDVWPLGKNSLSQKGVWYVLQTNYDHWKYPPFYDDRRTPGIKCMDEVGNKNMSFRGLYNVLSTIPVLNKLTAYTTLMEVSSGKMETYLRDCPDPCSPW